MPAAAVIPAPEAYIFIAAVKKSVVDHYDTVSKLQFSKQVLEHFSMGRSEERNRWGQQYSAVRGEN